MVSLTGAERIKLLPQKRRKTGFNVNALEKIVLRRRSHPYLIETGKQSDQMIRKKSPNFSKNSPKSCQVKKGPNIYNKVPIENPKHLHQTTYKTLKYVQQTMFETAYLGKNVNKFA